MRAAIIALCLLAAPAHAKPIAAARMPNAAIVLDDQIGNCPVGAKKATWIGPAATVDGCWFLAHGFVWLFFVDGETGSIPQSAMKWESA
jgi:hypothetical protein